MSTSTPLIVYEDAGRYRRKQGWEGRGQPKTCPFLGWARIPHPVPYSPSKESA